MKIIRKIVKLNKIFSGFCMDRLFYFIQLCKIDLT